MTPSEEPASESGETDEAQNGDAEPSRPRPQFNDPLLNGSSAAKGEFCKQTDSAHARTWYLYWSNIY